MQSRSFKDHYSSPQCTATEIIIDASKMTVGDLAESEERRKEKLYTSSCLEQIIIPLQWQI